MFSAVVIKRNREPITVRSVSPYCMRSHVYDNCTVCRSEVVKSIHMSPRYESRYTHTLDTILRNEWRCTGKHKQSLDKLERGARKNEK